MESMAILTSTKKEIRGHSKLTSQSNRAFHGFGLAKFANGGLILGSSQFTSQLPLKMMLGLKVVKIDTKIINLFH